MAAVEVAKRLDGLPLALSTAGAYLCEVTTTWTNYLELYQESWLRLQQVTPQLPAYEYAMYSTWNISFTHIEKQHFTAAKLLTLWAYFDKDDLWHELLHQRNPAIPEWLQDVTEDQITFEQSMRVLCQHGLHVPDETESEFWWVQRRLLQHADHSLRLVENKDNMEDEAWSFGSLAILYSDQGRLGEAEAMYQRALQGYEKALGDNSVKTYPPALNTLENMGDLLREQDKGEAARRYYTRAEYCIHPSMCDDESTASETSSLDVTSCIDLVTPAAISWRCGDDKAALLKRIIFTIRHDVSTVLFRLRADVTFKPSSPPKTHLFFFKPPESLRTLILNQSANDAYGPTIKQWEEATRELGSAHCLRFELGRAGKAIQSHTFHCRQDRGVEIRDHSQPADSPAKSLEKK
ncbi:hypothetical protein J7T55_002358 [Diaporthe amygdali]|uniref:uncharacterized protein n=1 Tax=Phomopsis amygdali TaxID=1214568 RepID=UPI0022FDD609|nr:uncharacterized protein J7T55_002358 [Diaporthe amygdali]KAJ0103742.1 hypothetical protein J7T55_002358 [Diaporthe amygdali]